MSKQIIYFKSVAYLILFFFLVLLLQQCSPSKSKEKNKTFDSLVKTMSRNINYNADSSLKTSKVILSLAQENNNPFQMYVAAKLMGNSYELSGKNDSAIKYYVVMKDIAFQINDSSKIVQVCSYLGNVFLDKIYFL